MQVRTRTRVLACGCTILCKSISDLKGNLGARSWQLGNRNQVYGTSKGDQDVDVETKSINKTDADEK